MKASQFRSLTSAILFFVCAASTLPQDASAAPVFFSSRGNTLYRFNLTDPPETFVMSDRFAALSTDPNGKIWLVGRLDIDDDGFFELYSLADPCGIPTLVPEGDFLPMSIASMTFIGNTMYVVSAIDQSPYHMLATVDTTNETVTPVGATGNLLDRAESIAFNSATQTLYGIDNASSPVIAHLKIINWNPAPGQDPLTTIVGPTGQDSWTSGGSMYQATYYHLISQFSGAGFNYTLGTINLSTGLFTTVRLVDTNAPAGVIGLAILDVPVGSACPRTGACCIQGEGCNILSQIACINLGGTYQGDDVTCDADADGDGVTDCFDNCPETPAETPVDQNGCSCVQLGDETDPTIVNCPVDFQINLEEGCFDSLADFREGLIVSDNCDAPGALQVVQNPPPGTMILPGPTVVTITVTDSSGNDTTCTFTVTVAVDECFCGDVTPPVIETCAGDREIPAGPQCSALVPDLTGEIVATDNCTGPPPGLVEPRAGEGGLIVTQDPPAGTVIGLGPTVVTLTVCDQNENCATCQATITVTQGECPVDPCDPDLTPPVIEKCADDVTLQATIECNASVPDLTAGVIASDACTSQPADKGDEQGPALGQDLIITQSPLAGALIPLGETVVTLTVCDLSNNCVTCEATVTVEQGECPIDPCNPDITPPVIETCGEGATLQANAQCTAIIPDLTGDVVAGDFCTTQPTVEEGPQLAGVDDGLTITQNPPAGTVVGVGPTLVTMTVCDSSENCANCEVTVTVEQGECEPCGEGQDQTPPTIEGCPEDSTLNAGAGCTAALPDFTDDITVTDNCSVGEGITVTQIPAPGTLLTVGTHEVTLTAEDQAGNIATCVFDIVVDPNNCDCGDNDAQDPVISQCPPDQTVLADANCEAIVPDLTDDIVATDNCSFGSDLSITQEPAAGTVIDLEGTTVVITVADQNGNSTTCTVAIIVDPNGCESSNDNDNDNNGPGPQPIPPCDPNADDSLNLLFSILFHAPVCGSSCPLMAVLTICGFIAMKSGKRRRRRK